MKYILKLLEKEAAVAEEVQALFAGELNPVAVKAQKKVPVPAGLDLDAYINEPPSSSSEEEDDQGAGVFLSEADRKKIGIDLPEYKKTYVEPTEEELEKMRQTRKLEQLENPHYLKGEMKTKRYHEQTNDIGMNNIPVSKIDLSVPLRVAGVPSSDKYLKESKQPSKKKKRHRHGKKGKKHKDDSDQTSEEDIPVLHQVTVEAEEMPEGAKSTDEELHNDENDPHRALDINLDTPLDDSERLPVKTYNAPIVTTAINHDRKPAPVTPPMVFEELKKKRRHTSKEKRKEKKKHTKSKKKGHNVRSDSIEPPVSEAGVENHVLDEKKMDDIEFWLSGVDAAQKNISETKPSIEVNNRPVEPPTSLPVSLDNRLSDKEDAYVSHKVSK